MYAATRFEHLQSYLARTNVYHIFVSCVVIATFPLSHSLFVVAEVSSMAPTCLIALVNQFKENKKTAQGLSPQDLVSAQNITE